MIAVEESRTRESNSAVARDRRLTLALGATFPTAAAETPGLGWRFAAFGGRL
jgi:hypothetical protein